MIKRNLHEAILPTRLNNQISGLDYDESLNTEDYIYIESTDEVRQSGLKKFTNDFSAFFAESEGLATPPQQVLRDLYMPMTEVGFKIPVVDANGEIIVYDNAQPELEDVVTHPFFAPSMRLDIKKYFELTGLTSESFATQKILDGQVVHTLPFGEYPQTKVDDATKERLLVLTYGEEIELLPRSVSKINENYNWTKEFHKHPYIKDNNQEYLMYFNPVEVENHGIKEKKIEREFFKVEPIDYIIKNWDRLPREINPLGTGEDDFFEVSSEKLFYAWQFADFDQTHYLICGGNDEVLLWNLLDLRFIINGKHLENVKHADNAQSFVGSTLCPPTELNMDYVIEGENVFIQELNTLSSNKIIIDSSKQLGISGIDLNFVVEEGELLQYPYAYVDNDNNIIFSKEMPQKGEYKDKIATSGFASEKYSLLFASFCAETSIVADQVSYSNFCVNLNKLPKVFKEFPNVYIETATGNLVFSKDELAEEPRDSFDAILDLREQDGDQRFLKYKNITQVFQSYVAQAQGKDIILPIELIKERDCSDIIKNHDLFNERIIKPFIQDKLKSPEDEYNFNKRHSKELWSYRELYSLYQIADNLGCFSDKLIVDSKNQTCTASERGIRLLEKAFLSGKGFKKDLETVSTKFLHMTKASLLIKEDDELMTFLEENLEDYLIICDSFNWQVGYLFDKLLHEEYHKMNHNNKSHPELPFNIFKRNFEHFKKTVYEPYLKNPHFLESICERIGKDVISPKECFNKICQIYAMSGCFTGGWSYGQSSYIKRLCEIHNKFVGPKAVVLNQEDFDNENEYRIISNKITTLLREGALDNYLKQNYNKSVSIEQPQFTLVSYFFKDYDLLNSVYGEQNAQNLVGMPIDDYEKIYTFAQTHYNTKVQYPMPFIRHVENSVLDSIADDKYFNGEVFNKYIKSEFSKLPTEVAVDFYKFAYSLGCFSDKKILDKKGNETKTTFAQKASIVLRDLLKSGELNIYEMHDLFTNLPYMEEPNQDFLTFIGQQEGKKFQNLAILKKFNQDEHGRFATIMANWENIKEYRTTLAEDGTPKKVNWEEAIRNYFIQSKFKDIREGYEELAEVMARSGVSQKQFDEAQDLFDKAKDDKIPEHILSKHLFEEVQQLQEEMVEELQEVKDDLQTAYDKNFTFEMLSKKDPKNVIIGLYCGCCATITGTAYGADIARATVTAKDVQNMVIRNKQGEIISKGTLYVNREQGYVVINDFEMNEKYRQHEKNSSGYYDDEPNSETAKTRQEIFDTYMRGVYDFVEEYDKENPDKPIQTVVVGRLYNRLKKQCEEFEKLTQHFTVPAEYSFKDAQEAQFVLYSRDKAMRGKLPTQKREGGLTL